MIDLRSDTVTRPSDGMRAAMMAARVGDDVYGEDPTAQALEERCAEMFGMAAAVFLPTVTMGNLIGLALHARPGDEIICDVNAHIVRYESGTAAASAGIQTRTTTDPRGRMLVPVLSDMVRSGRANESSSGVRTAAVAFEQTQNHYGGRIQPLDDLRKLREFTAEREIRVHCDGARVWNASVASGRSLTDYGAVADTITVCLSKGLGCPAGALLILAEGAAVSEARRLRRRFGGSMRQIGIFAAAGLYALDHHLDRLAEDHRRAKQLSAAVEEARPGIVAYPVGTNIIYIDLPMGHLDAVIADCRAQGVLITGVHGKRARMITHLDVSDADIARAIEVLTERLRALPADPQIQSRGAQKPESEPSAPPL